MKTTENNNSVKDYINSVQIASRRADALKLLEICEQITGDTAKMWGDSIVGFGKYHYQYKSGREGEFFITGFSARKQHLVIYLMDGCRHHVSELENMGTHKTGSSCLYIKGIDHIDLEVLKNIISASVDRMRRRYH